MADLNRLNALDQAERWLAYLTHNPMPNEETQAAYAATAQAWTLAAIFDVLKEMNASLKRSRRPRAPRAPNANIITRLPFGSSTTSYRPRNVAMTPRHRDAGSSVTETFCAPTLETTA